MKKRGSVGRQLHIVFLFAILIPILIIGSVSATILTVQMNDRYEDQIKNENTRVKSILFDVTSSIYTNLEPIISVQEYRDMFSSDEFGYKQKIYYNALNSAMTSLKRTTAAISSINLYTNNPCIPTDNYIVNVGKSENDGEGYSSDNNQLGENESDPFAEYEWYDGIDPTAWDTYTCIHVPVNEYEDAYELALVRRFNTGTSDNKAYIVVTVSTNYLRNRLLTSENYMLACLADYPVFFSSEYDEQEREMPEVAGADPDDYNYLGDMVLNDKIALTYVSSFAPYKVNQRFFVLVGDYDAHDAVGVIQRDFLFMLLASVIGPIIVIFIYSAYFSGRLKKVREAMHRASIGDYDIIDEVSGDDELSDTFKDLKITTEQIRENEAKYYEAKIHEQELVNMQQNMEFKMLSGQINPHFLYNTLEAIRMQAIRGGDRNVATSVKYLAKIMHYVLESTGKSTATLAEELSHVDSYMQIQRLRFGDKVNWKFYIADDFDPESYNILPLLIQPIVENAVGHGLKDMDKNGHVSIIIEYDKERKLVVTINDDGLGMTGEEVAELNASLNEKRTEDDEKGASSIGLYNINQRIKLYYGEEYGLFIRSQKGKGTSVVLTLPENTMYKN